MEKNDFFNAARHLPDPANQFRTCVGDFGRQGEPWRRNRGCRVAGMSRPDDCYICQAVILPFVLILEVGPAPRIRYQSGCQERCCPGRKLAPAHALEGAEAPEVARLA